MLNLSLFTAHSQLVRRSTRPLGYPVIDAGLKTTRQTESQRVMPKPILIPQPKVHSSAFWVKLAASRNVIGRNLHRRKYLYGVHR
jgi:hypothetical protein